MAENEQTGVTVEGPAAATLLPRLQGELQRQRGELQRLEQDINQNKAQLGFVLSQIEDLEKQRDGLRALIQTQHGSSMATRRSIESIEKLVGAPPEMKGPPTPPEPAPPPAPGGAPSEATAVAKRRRRMKSGEDKPPG